MSGKVILVILDALGHDAAVENCGWLEGLVESRQARRWRMRSALPSLSAPIYETLHTGTPPAVHGIRSNDHVPLSKGPHVFGVARAAGRKTAAVAHYFFSELYNRSPWQALRDAEVDDPDLAIQHGRFYSERGYQKFNLQLPSEHDLCVRTTLAIRRHQPDYLLLHSFSIDAVGHGYGADSREYRKQVWMVDNALAEFLHLWTEAGYRVLITADHGMTPDGRHGGNSEAERMVAFYDVGHPEGGVAEATADQLAVAPTILKLMGLQAPPEMKATPLG